VIGSILNQRRVIRMKTKLSWSQIYVPMKKPIWIKRTALDMHDEYDEALLQKLDKMYGEAEE
jgi:hypothetical protein